MRRREMMRFSAQMKNVALDRTGGVASWVDRVKAEIMGIDVDGMEHFLLGRLVVLYICLLYLKKIIQEIIG